MQIIDIWTIGLSSKFASASSPVSLHSLSDDGVTTTIGTGAAKAGPAAKAGIAKAGTAETGSAVKAGAREARSSTYNSFLNDCSPEAAHSSENTEKRFKYSIDYGNTHSISPMANTSTTANRAKKKMLLARMVDFGGLEKKAYKKDKMVASTK